VDEFLTDVQAQTQSLLPAILDRSLRHAVIALPDALLLLRRDARTLILYPDTNGYIL
jgi:hypothetical protein